MGRNWRGVCSLFGHVVTFIYALHQLMLAVFGSYVQLAISNTKQLVEAAEEKLVFHWREDWTPWLHCYVTTSMAQTNSFL